MGYRIARYFAAAVAIFYGFAKVNHAQFTMLDSQLDRPLREVSGFWLVWYFFGYSAVYGTIVAWIQIMGGLALTFRRTALLGACVLTPVFANIVMIDVFFGVDPGALMVALLTLSALLSIVFRHRGELLRVLWAAPSKTSPVARWGAWAVRVGLVIYAACFSYWVANYNNRSPTPLDGVWSVTSTDGEVASKPGTFFFEYNRAHMLVIKSKDGIYQTRHFEVDTTLRRLAIYERWLRKGEKLFDGEYELRGRRLTLRGRWLEQPLVVELSNQPGT